MKIGPKYRFPFKRRLKEQTDYKNRLKLLLSKKPRLVVRKSLKHMRAQIIEFHPEGDKVLVSAFSQDLKKLGWDSSTSNIPSSYLVGLLIGKKALKKKIKTCILDTGLQTNIKGSRIYAVLRGVIDAGLDISYSPDVLPADERIKGQHILNYEKSLDKKKSKNQFSKNDPKKIPNMFENVKSKIMKE
ncbi:MAG: 50S ribosomal protein L18 [Candidatus Aenigmarchaeota archaeon]|nr:50S ribosomal protein L18 [Candidatus Aenigmarchaeota archaeon]